MLNGAFNKFFFWLASADHRVSYSNRIFFFFEIPYQHTRYYVVSYAFVHCTCSPLVHLRKSVNKHETPCIPNYNTGRPRHRFNPAAHVRAARARMCVHLSVGFRRFCKNHTRETDGRTDGKRAENNNFPCCVFRERFVNYNVLTMAECISNTE